MPSRRTGPTARYRLHMFDRICREHGIEHRLTKPNHPWTNGQVERMNRTLKEATVRRYHYETHRQLREHLEAFLNAYNFAKRLKTLRGLTPLRAPLQSLGRPAQAIQIRPNPPHFGTEHLGRESQPKVVESTLQNRCLTSNPRKFHHRPWRVCLVIGSIDLLL
jgi:hypothetical protein